jgi:hypothetical protein
MKPLFHFENSTADLDILARAAREWWLVRVRLGLDAAGVYLS